MLEDPAALPETAALECLFQLSAGPLCLLDREGRLLRWNPAFAEAVGRTPAQLGKGSRLHWVARADRPDLKSALARAARCDEAISFEARTGPGSDGQPKRAWRLRRVSEGGPIAVAAEATTPPPASDPDAPPGPDPQSFARTIAEHVPVIVAYYDADERLRYGNAAYAAWIGQPVEALIGKRRDEIMPRDLLRDSEPVVRAALAGVAGQVRSEIRYADGHAGVMQVDYVPDQEPDGKVRGLLVMGTDITALIRVQEDLQHSERLLRTFLDAIPLQMYVKGLDNRFLLANRRWGEFFDLDPTQCEQITTEDLPRQDPEFVEATLAMDDELLRTGESQMRELRVRSGDGRGLIHRNFKAPLRNDSGAIIGICGFAEDVTERVEAEQRLRENQQLLRTLIDAVPQQMFVKGLDGRYLLANRVWGEFFGVDPLLCQTVKTDTLPQQTPEFIATIRAMDREVMETGVPQMREVAPRSIDGEERVHRNFRAAQRNDAGEIIGLFGFSEDVSDMVEAREALRQSEARIKSILGAIPDLMFVLSADARILDFHAHDPSLLVVEDEVILGIPIRELLPPAASDSIEATITEVLASGTLRTVEYDLDVIAGPRSFEARIVPHAEGQVLAMVRDVSEARVAELELRTSRSLLQALFDAIPFPVTLKGRDNRYIMVNRAMGVLRGVPAADMVGQTLATIPGGAYEDPASLVDADRTVLETGQTVDLPHIALQLSDGRRREVRMIKAPYHDGNGEVAGIVTLGVDTTEFLDTERRLRASEARFRQTVENIPAAIFLKDLEGTYTMVNRQMERLTGLERDKLLGVSAREIFPDHVADFEEMDRIVRETGAVTSREIEFRAPDGQFRNLLDTKFPMFDPEGKLNGIGVILTDLTEQRRAEMQLRQAQKMEVVGQLAGGVAHDFNNILQIITGYTAILLRQESLTEVARESVEEVHRAAVRAADLTRKLLAFSRQQTLHLGPVDVNALIRDQMQMVRRVLGEQVQLELRLTDAPVRTRGDAGALEQVLLNLCINARDAMPKGGQLTITTEALVVTNSFQHANPWAVAHNYVCISVTDTGTGMPEPVREHIFEPFFTTKGVGQGSGLGLAMVYGIMAEHNGHIEVESTPQQGSTFRIFLPATDADPVAKSVEASKLHRSGDATLLVAEDEQDVLRLLTALLEEEGYRVVGVSDGADAVAYLRKTQEPVDLLILDMIMPRMGGREAYETIREMGITAPVLFSTGYDANAIDAEVLAGPGVYLIEKPYQPSELFRAVHKALGRG